MLPYFLYSTGYKLDSLLWRKRRKGHWRVGDTLIFKVPILCLSLVRRFSVFGGFPSHGTFSTF